MNKTQPVLFLSHGGPTLAVDNSDASRFMKSLGGTLNKPKAIVIFSGHLDSDDDVVITSGASPSVIYDFYGFPKPLYELTYPAPGAPDLAYKIADMVSASGYSAVLDEDLGWDHGVWIPLRLIYPDADIPVVQVSISSKQGAKMNYELGKMLAPLRKENVLLIGSGAITHNLREIFSRQKTPNGSAMAEAFTDWIAHKLENKDHEAVVNYLTDAPNARFNHPTDDHFLPLVAALGASGEDDAVRIHQSWQDDKLLAMDAYRFG
ncbi:dioxygenase [Grimontia sp. S25]|uniref:Dioxygenase n=1 Tax=Grimontia sedimenti TaxID=2711294 RepID=A0A6M1RNW4_9GAMM|nr:class III extradiol ring-cleavage dioxygenase [Grimontia sedimenti]NGN99831.1 dioxygenase [Grimontia sedimenti]